jgi:flagellar motor protein MotB
MLKNLLFLIIVIVYSSDIKGQESYPECIHPEIISLPLINDSTHEKIYYQQVDKYTYWYKITVKESGELSYKLSSISKADDYEILIYNFKGGNFCNDVVNKKAKPTYNKLTGLLKTKKGETYYIGVLHLNGFGCGHMFEIVDNNKRKTYKTIQNNCVEEALETIVEIESKKIVVVEPEIIEKLAKYNGKITGLVVNSSTQQNIKAMVSIWENGSFLKQINSSIDNGFLLKNYIGKKIILSVKKLGYKPFLDTVDVNSSNIIIELTPINIGEKLVMHKIYFHPNTYVLKETSKKELNKLLTFMLENKEYFFEIQGHTNGNRMVKKSRKHTNLGEDWNFKGSSKKLSKYRAEKIKTFLTENGISESQIKTFGFGGDKMIVEKPRNMREAMKNIRVEVIVVQ